MARAAVLWRQKRTTWTRCCRARPAGLGAYAAYPTQSFHVLSVARAAVHGWEGRQPQAKHGNLKGNTRRGKEIMSMSQPPRKAHQVCMESLLPSKERSTSHGQNMGTLRGARSVGRRPRGCLNPFKPHSVCQYNLYTNGNSEENRGGLGCSDVLLIDLSIHLGGTSRMRLVRFKH